MVVVCTQVIAIRSGLSQCYLRHRAPLNRGFARLVRHHPLVSLRFSVQMKRSLDDTVHLGKGKRRECEYVQGREPHQRLFRHAHKVSTSLACARRYIGKSEDSTHLHELDDNAEFSFLGQRVIWHQDRVSNVEEVDGRVGVLGRLGFVSPERPVAPEDEVPEDACTVVAKEDVHGRVRHTRHQKSSRAKLCNKGVCRRNTHDEANRASALVGPKRLWEGRGTRQMVFTTQPSLKRGPLQAKASRLESTLRL